MTAELRTTRTFQQNKTVRINELKPAVEVVSAFGFDTKHFYLFKGNE